MLINIHDSHLEKVGFLDSESPGAPGFFNDVEHHYLPEGASTFTFSVNKKKNGILQDYCQFLNEDAYFSFSENGEDHFYSVGTVDEDNDTTFTVTCYSLNLELRLEQCDPLENTASHNIQWYFDQMELINNTQITIGINEVSDLSRVIKYDGQESKLARLISLIGNFDAEFEFITKSNNDGTLDKIILNIYKQNDGVNFQGVGTNRDDVILTLDTNITGVSRTVDKTQIFNATTITGADGLTWNSSEFSYVNSDGVEEFYKRKNADTAFAPLSLAKYPSQIQSSTGDRWIRKNFTTDYTSANAIWGYAVSQFKKFAYGIVTYKVSVSSLLVSSEVGNGLPLKIGDTVTISDDNFIDSNGVHGLILSARVSEMEISRTDPTKNTLVFSNYIRLQSQISNDLQSQLSNLVDAATPFRAELSTTNGTQFKNGTGSTTLSAHIFKGSATTETVADSYEWSKDGTVVANAQTITVDASGVVDKAVYSFKATVGGKVVASQSVTITNVNDGTNGRSVTNVSQKWRLTTTTATPTQAWSDAGWLTTQPTTTATNKYLWSITRTTFNLAPLTQDVIEQKAVYGDKGDKGDTGNDGIAGKDGVGIKTTVITYAISTNETTAPATGWTSSVPSLVKGQYLWTKTVWNYSDGTSESGYTVTYIAKDGNNGNDGIAGKDGVGLINTTLRYAKSKDGVNKPEGRIVASFTDKFIPARSIIDNLIMTGKQVHLEQGKTYILSAETNGIFTNVHNVEQSNNATIWIVNPSFSTWDIISDTNTAIGTKYTHNRPTGDYEIRINSYEIDNSIWVKNIVFEDGTWTPDIPVANPGEYLWTRTTWFYSDNTNETGFSVAKMGEQGPKGDPGKDGIAGKDGVGIKTTVITYAISTNETTAPATGWTSSVPSLVKGQYLWTKTVWTYTDNSSETGYSVTYISKDGNNGTNGIAGKDGVGIKTTTITYAGSTNGTTAPNTGWTSTVPTVAAGNYLWTKTVWAYTDNTSETGYSVAMMGVKGERGKQIFKSSYESVPHNNFHYWSDLSPAPSIDNPPKIGDTVITPSGNILQIDTVNVGGGGGGGTFGVGDVLGNIKGPSGSNGDPGKVVSDTEPTTRFKGLTWKYSGTTDLTASDGTVIKPNVEYYYNGTHWVINYFSVNNFAAESITSDKIDGKNLTITDGEFISKTTNGPVTTSTEIKDNHISISKTDGTVNTRNDIALDSEQGLAQKFTNINTGFYRTAGINYQGPFTSDSDGNFAQLTPQGTKLSTDVPWTKLSLMNNFNGNIEYAIINGTVYISASGVGVPAMTAGQWKQAAQLPTGSSAIPIRANRIAAGDSVDGLSWALLSNQAGGIFIRCSGNKSPTANLFNATLPYPIG